MAMVALAFRAFLIGVLVCGITTCGVAARIKARSKSSVHTNSENRLAVQPTEEGSTMEKKELAAGSWWWNSEKYAGAHFSDHASAAHVADSGKSFGVAFADVDNDGDLDLFVANSESLNKLFMNMDGKGTFQDTTSTAGLENTGKSRGATFADVNGDGALDLYVTDTGEGNHLYIGDGKGHFQETKEAGVSDTGFGQTACFADVDADGDVDLFVANWGQSNTLYINDGKGVFANATVQAGLASPGVKGFGCAFGDVDGDGDLDLYVNNAESFNKLYINNGKGIFTDKTSQAGVAANKGNGRAVAFADLNGDGHLDLYMVGTESGVNTDFFLFFGDGAGHFTDGTDAAGMRDVGIGQGLSIADYDGDGDLDIFVSNVIKASVLYENDGTGKFKDITSNSGVGYHLFGQGVSSGDIDGDGTLDMYVCTFGSPLNVALPSFLARSQNNKLLVNDGSVAAWLNVQPHDENGHKTLLGAEVRVYEAGTRKQASVRMQIDGGSGFASQNPYGAYFGLSTAVRNGAKKFDIEVRCGGQWNTKESNADLGGVIPNGTISVMCTRK